MQQTKYLDNIKPDLQEYAELRDEKKAIEARMDTLNKRIRPILEGHGSVRVGKHLFECTMSAGRKTLDKKSLENELGDIERFYKIGKPFTTLKVTEAEE